MKKLNKKDLILNQDLSKEVEFRSLFQMHLLFEEKAEKPNAETIQNALRDRFGETDIVSKSEDLMAFAVHKFKVEFKNHVSMPAQVIMAGVGQFNRDNISILEKSQLWDVENGEELLEECNYSLILSNFMSITLPYKELCELLIGWLETVLSLFSTCKAIWIPSAGKLLKAEDYLNCPVQGDNKFVYLAVNTRFFKLQGTKDMLIDTLGLYAIGLPDVQCHFHDIDPNKVVNYIYNAASYIFATDASIKSGETIDGLDENGILNQNVRWKCQYEKSLIQPVRDVMDICPNEYAAGQRE